MLTSASPAAGALDTGDALAAPAATAARREREVLGVNAPGLDPELAQRRAQALDHVPGATDEVLL